MLRNRPRAVWSVAIVFIASAAFLGIANLSHVRAQTVADEPAMPAARHRPNATLLGSTQEPLVRVRIVRSEDSLRIDGPANLLVSLEARPGSTQLMRAPVEIVRTARSWRLESAEGSKTAIAYVGHAERRSALVVRPMGGLPVEVRGANLPGQLLIMPEIDGNLETGQVSASRFHVVEELAIESYLPGVIAKELIPGWRLGAFQAQAIAARSYALQERRRSRREQRRWDLESSEVDQVYAGATTNDRAIRGVSSTRGVVLTWERRILRAYYSSTCGGRSAAARDVWPSGKGHEFNRARPIQGYGQEDYCERSPLHRWTVLRPVRDLTRRLAAYGHDRNFAIASIGEFTRFEQVAWNDYGRPTRYRIYGRRGKWWELKAEQLRIACNWTGSSGVPAVTRATRVSSGDLVARRSDDEVTIDGRGFGHGVGLCQYGAQRQAELGRAPQAILMHYYPEASLERAYY